MTSSDEVLQQVREAIGLVLDEDPAGLDEETTFAHLGMDSLLALDFFIVLEDMLDLELTDVQFDVLLGEDRPLPAARLLHGMIGVS